MTWAQTASPISDSKISVVIVMFNSAETIKQCLMSIPTYCEVVLVDQCSGDESIVVAEKYRPDARLIKAGANRGFGAGCNIGAANASGDVLIFLNPDASFLSSDDAEALAKSVRSLNAFVGPRIVDAEGTEQTRARNWSTIYSELGEAFLPGRLAVGRLRRDLSETDSVYKLGGPVPYIQGSCMAVSSQAFWQVGGFDERLFLYREEETLALSLKTIGVNAALDPNATICHIGAKSTSQYRTFAARQYYRSLSLFFLIRYPKAVAVASIIAVWAALVTMAALSPIRMVTGPRKNNDYRWYRAAAAGAISGWRREIVEPPTQCRLP